ncbi:MAG: FAD-dependent monooxygenase [Mycolicibacterium cosmeticum]|nr:FAD-dependent monooxygenase [Mycolicibacterium cosmeticum]
MRVPEQRVLVSGASFAGLATAFWMRRQGYAVTVVESAQGIRRGGAAVNIQDGCVDVVRDMGLLEEIRANRLSVQRFEFKNVDDVTERVMTIREPGEPPSEADIEVERDVLLNLLVGTIEGDVEMVFGDSVTSLREVPGGMEATFARAAPRTFDLVFGCDGFHSAVRRIWFGDEAEYAHFLGPYFSISIVEKLLIDRDTAQMFNVPGRAVMLNAYKNKTDIIFAFTADGEIAYDYRDQEQQRRMISERFSDVGWRTAELLGEVRDAGDFYFDRLGQIRMPSWTKGRVALVGDAGYCASPAAGRGASLALEGAAALAGAMRGYGTDYERAFRDYEERLRPLVDEIQTAAVTFGLESLVPMTQEAIDARNARVGNAF